MRIKFMTIFMFIFFLLLLWGCNKTTEPKNESPTIIKLAAYPTNVVPGGMSVLTCIAKDNDNDNDDLIYTWMSSSDTSFIKIDPIVVWTAPKKAGLYSFSCMVEDGEGGFDNGNISVLSSDTIKVADNKPPVIQSLTANPTTVSPVGMSILTCIANDPDDDSLSYTWISAVDPSFSKTDQSFIWTAPKKVGLYSFSCIVDDSKGGLDLGNVSILVSDTVKVTDNKPPVILSLAANPTNVAPGEISTLSCTAKDPDNDNLTYTWALLSDTLFKKIGQTITWAAPVKGGLYSFSCTVSDGKGGLDLGNVCVFSSDTLKVTDVTLHGVITDGNTNERLSNVKVSWVENSKMQSTLTNEIGYYIIFPLKPFHKYELTFSGLEDYSISRAYVEIGYDTSNVVLDMNLYKLNAALTGRIYKKQDNENTFPASGVTVIADFKNCYINADNFVRDVSPEEYTTVTNSDGIFSFTNLPAAPSVGIRTMPYNDGSHNYSVKTAPPSTLIPNGTVDIGNMILNIASATPFIVQNNFENDNFILVNDIIVTFSKAMDKNGFYVSLAGNTFGPVGFEVSWSNNITLTIDPFVPLQANEYYSLTMDGKSLDGNNFSGSYLFRTQKGIEYVKTNLERVHGVFDEFPVDSNITITFDMVVDLSNSNGYVYLKDASNLVVSRTLSLSSGSKTLIINPVNNLEPGQSYSLQYKIYSNIVGDYDSRSFSFQTASSIVAPNQVTDFDINYEASPNWPADWNTTSIKFIWNTVENADGYRIYAKDNHNNSDFVQVAAYTAQDYVVTQTGTVNISSQFDYYENDGMQTPFTNGTEITFEIVAYNSAGEGVYSNPLIVKDETAPVISISQNGNADNTTGEHPTFDINMNQIEYCSSESNPTFAFVESGGDPDYVLSPSDVTWTWDPNLRDGKATVTVPYGYCAAGDMLIMTVKDNSGNISEPNTLYLAPIISFEAPTPDTLWEAPNAYIDWSINNLGVSPSISGVDLFLSVNGGTSWIDTLVENRPTATSYYSWSIPDTLMSNNQAVIGITDHNGGYIWKSGLFTISGIRVTAPTSSDNKTDSTQMTITWDYVGVEKCLVEYQPYGGAWSPIDTVENTGIYNWTPELGLTNPKQHKIRISDFDADKRPRDESDWFKIYPY